MREPFENIPRQDPVEAARRGAVPEKRRRFYETVGSAAPAGGGGFEVLLDGKPALTPGGRILAVTSAPLAQAIVAEWQAQGEVINPASMPLTRLANSIIDGVSDRADAVAAEVKKYLTSDLICYRATSPQKLVERQVQHWDPIVSWAEAALGARFLVTDGVVHIAQPDAALAAAGAAIPQDAWRLGAVHAATTLAGSALIALALAEGRLSADEAWAAAHVDEDWNIAKWGEDELAMERRAFRFAEFAAAAMVLERR
jgi:chaperone required for assembly of F1-ATPase